MTTVEIIGELKKYGITATRQTLYDDIEVLNQYGYEIICDKYGNPTNYRIDRMHEMQAEPEEITKSKEFESFDLVAHKRELFSMFAG